MDYMTNQDTIHASDIVAEVMHLETTLSLSLHLMGAPIGKTLDLLSADGKAVN